MAVFIVTHKTHKTQKGLSMLARPKDFPKQTQPLPVIALMSCVRSLGPHPFHVVGDKYVAAISHGAQAWPWPLPALGSWYDWPAFLAKIDGVLLTGSPSNIAPEEYGTQPAPIHGQRDFDRDATSLPLIRHVLAANIPLLAICRGFQELNVALGGSLQQSLPAPSAHHPEETLPIEEQYRPWHGVDLAAKGQLAQIMGVRQLRVNSLHYQAVDRLARDVEMEAQAPDGLVEAIRVKGADFALGVQWHPEWKFWQDPASSALFLAFGQAARKYAAQKLQVGK
jgi:putative glutamine amidotransferase